jgi:GNAT superfamily N-acetyltransferase
MVFSTKEIYFKTITPDLDLTSFLCRDEDLESFLKDDALENQLDRFSVTRIAYYRDIPVGYFTLLNDIITKKEIPRRKQPRYTYSEYPAVKIARLATRTDFERNGIGTMMLTRSVAIAIKLSEHVGCRFITVDSKPEATAFYEKFGFLRARLEETPPEENIPLYIDFHAAITDGRNKKLADYQ